MDLLIFPGIPLFAAYWVYGDAKDRGSSAPILWAIGVFGLLIVFLPLYFLIRPSKKERSLLCPHCGKYYESTGDFCPHCGQSLTIMSVNSLPSNSQMESSETTVTGIFSAALKGLQNHSLTEGFEQNTTSQNYNKKPIEDISASSSNYLKIKYPQITEKKIKSCPIDYVPNSYVILDLETTGLNPKEDSIIEIGCIKIKEGKEVDRFETFIKPAEAISERITEITGINNEMIVNAPQFNYIANQLWKFLKDEIIVGHNVKFDINFLYENFLNSLGLSFYNNYLDTLSLSREVYQDVESYKLEDLAKKLKVESQNHRAMADCILVKELLNDLMNEMVKNKMLIEIPPYKLLDFNAEISSKYVINLIKTVEKEDYLKYGIIQEMCDKLVDEDLATSSLCKKMASVCEKFKDYESAISFYNAAMDIDPELDFYKKIDYLENKLYKF